MACAGRRPQFACAAYCNTVLAMPAMQEWIEAAKAEHEDLEELDIEFLNRPVADGLAVQGALNATKGRP